VNPVPNTDPWDAVPARQEHLDAAKAIDDLSRALVQIEPNDTNYTVRYGLVLDALAAAHRAGYPAGIGWDGSDDPELDGFRALVYITLPTGQVSWHMPVYPHAFDGHTTPEKHARINTWLADVLPF
jgi:hypothetical protein